MYEDNQFMQDARLIGGALTGEDAWVRVPASPSNPQIVEYAGKFYVFCGGRRPNDEYVAYMLAVPYPAGV